MQIQLSWEDPATGERRSPLYTLPVAIGREFAKLPTMLGDRRVSRVALDSGQVSRYHVLLDQDGAGVVLIDQGSSNGTMVNGMRHSRSFLANGDTLQIGPFQITVTLGCSPAPAPAENSTILFHPDTGLLAPQFVPAPPLAQPVPAGSAPTTGSFPPPLFQAAQVSIRDLLATGLPVQEFDYAALGAGLGSFIWTDLLRIGGVKVNQITAIGIEDKPYARYQRLCVNSQIPPQERLRSNSDSCPDNIWGFPSYAFREAWHDLKRGQVGSACRYLWQVFAEPTFAETYTPRSGNVFDSSEREMARIGWSQIYQYGRIRAIRKTDDGRYAIAFSRTTANQRDHAFVVARYVHLALGYPAIQFLPDLQAYREATQDFKTVVNAYEAHEHVYEKLAHYGGTVMIRGRGIVASRIVQRLYEIRQRNANIALLHLLRSPKPKGNRYGRAQRVVKHHYELQPFNWPKACWGGDLRAVLEAADPQQRKALLADWGGTTTADRRDWQRIVQEGIGQGWYQITFGEVEKVESDGQGGTLTTIQEKDFKGKIQLKADFIIDATGLDAKPKTSPLMNDLVTHYNLPLNPVGRLAVTNEFELAEMRSENGRLYVAGAMTLGGPHAAVDSFLGLQYATLKAVDSLTSLHAPNLQKIDGIRSLSQWLRWAANQAPS
ncbi:FHA domain-containing protein [Phormidium tenue FACHB-886]|nr:FHA domain-containing protein [Phormidium tenue FACHB-886]